MRGNVPSWHLHCYCVAERTSGASGSLGGCREVGCQMFFLAHGNGAF